MKKGFKIWNVLYPIGIYYVISSLAYYLVEGFFGAADETYMLRQTICSALTIPFIYKFFRDDRKRREKNQQFIPDALHGKELVVGHFQAVALLAALGISVNNILAMTPLVEMSEGFSQANAGFFGGKLIFELAGSCLIIPIAEELLFRGVLYRRIKLLLSDETLEKEYELSVVTVPAIVLSALLFGVVHANLVQFLYATVLGLALAFLLEKTGSLSVCIVGHITANLIAVIRQNTGFLAFGYEPGPAGIALSAALLVAAAALLFVMIREFCAKRNS